MKKVAIRPPEYFPRLSYLALLQEVDLFVLADTFQYSRQSYQNRTQLRTPQGWQWISVPLKGRQHGLPIVDVQIEENDRWDRKHLRALKYNYNSTPFFPYFEQQVRELLELPRTGLADLTCATIRWLCRVYRLDTEVIQASNLPGCPATLDAVFSGVEADILISPQRIAQHDHRHVEAVEPFGYESLAYRQQFEGFETGMSSIDLFFNHGPSSIAILSKGNNRHNAGTHERNF